MATKNRDLSIVLLAYLVCSLAGLVYLTLSSGDLLLRSFVADLIATLVIFGFSRAFKNSSFYDAYWSVIPPLFLLYWWYSRDGNTELLRYALVSIVVWFWALRLTWNWIKHWQGMQHEDWRYIMLKQKFQRQSLLIDFVAIHLVPTLQVFLGMLPMYAAIVLGKQEVNWLDYLAFAVGIAAVILEMVADRQLHAFKATNPGDKIIDSGLWAHSRHPNYLGEILFWLSLALFGIAAHPQGWWWEISGVVAMVLLFVLASIPMMEQRSLERRPQYQQIIDRIPMLLPLPGKRH